jgi:hypothetical protein
MNKRIGIAASVLVGMLLVVLACKKIEQPEMAQLNQECDCAKEVSADFVMEEMTTGNINFAQYTPTDTILEKKNVRFRALEDGAIYTWYIGQEVLTTQQVTRYFGESLVNQSLPIVLVVKKSPNSICFPNDDGYDSIVKFLTVSDRSSFPEINPDYVLEGSYKVKEKNGNDSIIMNFDFVYVDSQEQSWNITNFDGNGTNCFGEISNFSINYRQLFVPRTTNCNHIQGSVHHRLDGITEIIFHTGYDIYNLPNYYTKTYHFLGRKL